MNKRSRAGRGEQVMIHLMDEPKPGEFEMWSSMAEDFAQDCHFPVVVKVKAQVTNAQLVTYLRKLASMIDVDGVSVVQLASMIADTDLTCATCGHSHAPLQPC